MTSNSLTLKSKLQRSNWTQSTFVASLEWENASYLGEPRPDTRLRRAATMKTNWDGRDPHQVTPISSVPNRPHQWRSIPRCNGHLGHFSSCRDIGVYPRFRFLWHSHHEKLSHNHCHKSIFLSFSNRFYIISSLNLLFFVFLRFCFLRHRRDATLGLANWIEFLRLIRTLFMRDIR